MMRSRWFLRNADVGIQVTQPLHPPTTAFLKALYDLPKGTGQSDFVNAITVAADIINRAISARPGRCMCRLHL